ncbi:hypothetical protein UNPF46_28035 [Bradyrhizobium sp. UNPF46]|nr:hypothetical protein UNPF46_28035 [Bradyrhizobium sp. UNPF46]
MRQLVGGASDQRRSFADRVNFGDALHKRRMLLRASLPGEWPEATHQNFLMQTSWVDFSDGKPAPREVS